ncbi:MAG: hypothetical protein QGG14_09245 [Planctomycetota bacterium]|nr:hypothetical protein [Planctomycetota bacterium]
MKFFRNMDALKLVILLSFGAAAVLGVWDWFLYGELQASRRAFSKAKADISTIHSLLKDISPLYVARQEHGAAVDYGVYFEKQLFMGGIKQDQYTLNDVREKEVRVSRKKKAIDKELRIDFRTRNKRDRLYLPRENLFKALLACEARSKAWRLRELRIRSRDDVLRKKKEDGYPAEIADAWLIEDLAFASREPQQKK